MRCVSRRLADIGMTEAVRAKAMPMTVSLDDPSILIRSKRQCQAELFQETVLVECDRPWKKGGQGCTSETGKEKGELFVSPMLT